MAIGSLRYAGGQDSGMRAARGAERRRTESVFLPAPVLGLNTMDAPETMKPGYAIQIVNWWLGDNGLTTRGGSAPWTAGFNGNPVDSVMVWNAQIAFGVADNAIFALPPQINLDRPPILSHSGLTSSRVESINFTTDGGTFLHCCNGTDAPFYFDGTNWTTAAFTRGGESFDASGFFAVTSHLRRLWWLKKGSQSVWYGDVESIQGPLFELPVGAYLSRGGNLAAIGTLTQDGLVGSDDFLVVISSEGEVLLFAGDNPNEATSWAMAGRGQIPRPLGAPRCLANFGPDLLVLTESGLMGVNNALSQEFPGLAANIGEKVRSYWDRLVQMYGTRFGWDICVYHGRDLIVINAPGNTGFQQLVVHPETKAWGCVQGWEQIRCLREFDGRLIGGGNTAVFALDYLHTDAVNGTLWTQGTGRWCLNAEDTSGSKWVVGPEATGVTWSIMQVVPEPVHARVQHGFLAVGGAGRKKRFTLARPYLSSSEQPAAYFELVEDFQSQGVLSQVFSAESGSQGTRWYAGKWRKNALDSGGSKWQVGPGPKRMFSRLIQALGYGYFASPIIGVDVTAAEATYSGIDLQYETGNTL